MLLIWEMFDFPKAQSNRRSLTNLKTNKHSFAQALNHNLDSILDVKC